MALSRGYQITCYSEAEHSLTNPDHEGLANGIAYHPLCHRVSWASTLAFLDYKLNGQALAAEPRAPA